MKIITVCGSLKFFNEMIEITEKMELRKLYVNTYI